MISVDASVGSNSWVGEALSESPRSHEITTKGGLLSISSWFFPVKVEFINKLDNTELNRCTIQQWMETWGHETFKCEGQEISEEGKIQKILSACVDPKNPQKIKKEYRYDQLKGLTVKSFKDFNELTPTHKVENHDGSYQFNVKIVPSHTFFELVDTDGNAYSVGLYGKASWPFKTIQGNFFSPDPTLADPKDRGRIETKSFKISEERFAQIKDRINSLQTNKGERLFNAGYYSCTDFVADILINNLGAQNLIYKKPVFEGLSEYMIDRFDLANNPKYQKMVAVKVRVEQSANYVFEKIKKFVPASVKQRDYTLVKESYKYAIGFLSIVRDYFFRFIAMSWYTPKKFQQHEGKFAYMKDIKVKNDDKYRDWLCKSNKLVMTNPRTLYNAIKDWDETKFFQQQEVAAQ